MSAAAKREDIQKRLQDLRAQKQKEKEAFDELATQSEGLSAEEMTALARQQAEKAAIEQSIDVGGAHVAIGDTVTVRDDVQRLQRAERGLFAPDAVKRVYLGESGKVVRVWSSFQGKPAVELRFADACTKVFFAECLELDDPAVTATPTATTTSPTPAGTTASSSVNRAGQVSLPAAEASPSAAPPSWSALSLPTKKRPLSKRASAAPTNTADTATTPVAATAQTTPAPLDVSEPPPSATLTAPASTGAAPVAEQVPLRDTPTPVTAPAVAAPEGLGKPTADLVLDVAHPAQEPAEAAEMDDLLRTPRPDFLAASTRSGGAHRMGSPSSPAPASPSPTRASAQEAESGIPTQCPSNYQPKFPLYDPESGIPRLVVTARAGAASSSRAPTVSAGTAAFRQRQSPRVATRGPSTPKREAPAPITPARTLGANQRPGSALSGVSRSLYSRASASAARPASAMRTPLTPTRTAGTAGQTGAASAKATRTGTGSSRVARPSSAQRPVVSAARAPSRTATRAAVTGSAPLAEARKPIQVRVFENGLYDNDAYDRVYRTITIRPTYKTIASLKSMIGRELLWRDGRKVELLFDASGAEINDLAEIREGQSLIASGGDRFAIPFPNSVLHAEALALSQAQ